MKSIKKKLSSLEKERNGYRDEVKAIQEEAEKLRNELSSKMNEKDNSIHKATVEDLNQKNEALESKLRKFLVHYEHLENECRTLKEENKIITELQDELKNVNLELARVGSDFEKVKSTNIQSEKFAVQIKDLNDALKTKDDEHSKWKTHFDELKEKYMRQKELNKNLKKSSQELEYEKNRQISYLENENLQYLGELKEMKKEVLSLKAQRRVLEIEDEPTEDLGFISKVSLQSVDESDKENCPNQSSVRKKAQTPLKERRTGLGASVSTEDEPGECKQS